MRTHSLLTITFIMAAAGCSDGGGSNQDAAVAVDSKAGGDTGSTQKDTGSGQKDTGPTQKDTGSTQKDTGSTQKDAGSTQKDGGFTPGCGNEFTAKDACGGVVSGTWKYKGGCVENSAFAELKKNCSGFTASLVKFTVDPQFNTLIFTAAGKFTRAIKGSISGNGHFPQSCTKLGCKLLEGVIKVA
mgnify:CR=1 FL=1